MKEREDHALGPDRCIICSNQFDLNSKKLERAVINPIKDIANEVVIPAGLHFFHEDCWIHFDTEERGVWRN